MQFVKSATFTRNNCSPILALQKMNLNTVKKIWLILSWGLLLIFFVDSFSAAAQLLRLDAEKIEVELEGEREIEDSLEDKLSIDDSAACVCQTLESATRNSYKAHAQELSFQPNPEPLYILYHQLKSHLA